MIKLISSMLIFGTVGLFVRGADFPSGFIAMARGYIGALVILAFMMIVRRPPSLRAIRENAIKLVLSGAFIGINWILLFESYSYTTVATATLCYYMAPVFVIIASPLLLSERVGKVRWACVLAALFGMVLVSEPWTASESGGLVGIALALLAALFYAAVTVTNKKMGEISALDRTVVQLFVASLVITPYTFIAENVSPESFTGTAVLLLVALGILHTGVAYVFYFGSIKDLSANTVAIFGYLDPIVAVLLSAIVLQEKITPVGAIGAVIVLVATLLSELLPSLLEKRKSISHTEETVEK